MAERRIVVGPSARASGRDLAIRINGPDPTFTIATDRLSTLLVAPVPARLLDLIEIASAVFAADSKVPRGGMTRPRFGSGWRRQFAFEIATREPAFWRRTELQAALAQAVDALSEDRARFSYTGASGAADAQEYFPFDPAANEAFACDDVILFSGGLDSLIGTLERLESDKGRVALVTHLSAQKRMPHQVDLVSELQRRYPGRVLWLPVQAHMRNDVRRESTQRTRTLLFAALAFTAARMLGGRRVTFFENGIVSQNLPISEQVIGTMATRTAHPLALLRLAELISMVAGSEITIENPYQWLTKTEVVSKLRELDAEDLVERTVSCSSIWKRTRVQPHCGTCSQCLDRRFAILGAGLAERDPAVGYETDVLTGARETDPSRTMAVEWARHAVELSEIDMTSLMRQFGGEATRIMEGFPGEAAVSTATRIVDMHRRHGASIRGVLKAAVCQSSGAVVAGRLDPTSLLAMFIRRQSGELVRLPAASIDAAPAESEAASDGALFPLRVELAGDASSAHAEVKGLGGLSPAPSRVVAALAPAHLEDRGAGKAPEEHRFVRGADAGRDLGQSAAYVRKNVGRCRSELADYYLAIEGEPPPRDLLIESRRPGGYRLEPECRVIRVPLPRKQARAG